MPPKAKAQGKAAKAAAAAPQKRQRSTAGAEEAKAAARMTSEEWKQHQVGQAQKWPAPAYMTQSNPRGASYTAYRDETYEIITRWRADTKISYRPHAKAPGSKSHVRYEEYSRAKTVAQALALGSWPADWCWDYERGFIRVMGPVRDEPLDPSKVGETDGLSDVDKVICRWYLKELAKKFGMTVEELKDGKCGGESLIMRAHRLVAQRDARRALEAARRSGRKVTEAEVLASLRNWAFAKNASRQNVLPEGKEWVWSDNMGLTRDRTGDIHVTASSHTYPEVVQLLNQYLTDRLPPDARSFKWTSLNVNCNYAAKLHRDAQNFGPSFIKAFGDFKGGELNYWPEDDRTVDKLENLRKEDKISLDLKNGLALFNGNSGHSVEPFEGERFSVVYFTAGCYDKATAAAKDGCRALGFQYPAPDADPRALLRAPKSYSGRAGRAAPTPDRRAAAGPPAWRFLPAREVDAGPGRQAGEPRKRQAEAAPAGGPRKRPAARAAAAAA